MPLRFGEAFYLINNEQKNIFPYCLEYPAFV